MRFTVLLEPERDLEIVKSVTILTLKKSEKLQKKTVHLVIRPSPGSPRKLKTAFGKVETEDSNTVGLLGLNGSDRS